MEYRDAEVTDEALKRLADTDARDGAAVAATVAHLAGDGGRYITGTAVTVDGGFAA